MTNKTDEKLLYLFRCFAYEAAMKELETSRDISVRRRANAVVEKYRNVSEKKTMAFSDPFIRHFWAQGR